MGRKDEEDAVTALPNRWKSLSVIDLMSRTSFCGDLGREKTDACSLLL